ncbi:hypothetical protein EIP86_003859 [Pleurotus ostreatoroseus]|nr:hypothetical protein EIP86_003859 [Pleurotus ostreatoroseus]
MHPIIVPFALALAFGGLCVARTQVISSSRTVQISSNATYYVPGTPVSAFKFGANTKIQDQLRALGDNGNSPLIPFSFITDSAPHFSSDRLNEIVALWSGLDDVWNPLFLDGVYLAFNGSGSPSTSLTAGQTSSIVITSDSFMNGISLAARIPPGPYFVDPFTGQIFQAWLLYNDEQQAFLYGTVPDGHGGFSQLSAHIDGAATESIAVPSRLYFQPSQKQPLAGARIGVKDIFDIKGLRTGCGNRAFYQFYPPKAQTAPSIQRLIDGGAIIIGKTKASQFANGESATDDWVDYHAPYNPRGDGYQDGSSSSTGSGTAIAAYPWLDYTVGSDTGGSMRGPASANGAYGNRPSHGAVVLDDVMPLSPALDTAGIFARDAKSWQTAGLWWYENFTSFTQFPKTILFPVDEFGGSFLTNPPEPGTADAMFNDFIKQLEGFLNTTRTEISLTNMWNETSPLIANVSNPPPSLSTMLTSTYEVLIALDQIQLVADPFIDAYKAAHNGQTPFIDPAPIARWNFARALSNPNQTHADAVTNKTIFMNWFQQTVLNGSDPTTCSPAIYLYPQNTGFTNYRNSYISNILLRHLKPSEPSVWIWFNQDFILF